MPLLSSEAQVKHSVLTKQKIRQTINSLQETQPLVSKPLGIYFYRGFLCLHDTYKQIQENQRGHCRAASGLPHSLLSSTIPSYRSSLNKYLKTQFTWLQTFPVTITSAQIFWGNIWEVILFGRLTISNSAFPGLRVGSSFPAECKSKHRWADDALPDQEGRLGPSADLWDHTPLYSPRPSLSPQRQKENKAAANWPLSLLPKGQSIRMISLPSDL